MEYRLELHNPKIHDHETNYIEIIDFHVTSAYCVNAESDGLYKLRIVNIDENKIIETLNHEIMHCVLSYIGEEEASKKYNGVMVYVDYIHSERIEDVDQTWCKIRSAQSDCPRCGGDTKLIQWKPLGFRCKKCGFVFDKELAEDWLKMANDESFLKVLREAGVSLEYWTKIEKS